MKMKWISAAEQQPKTKKIIDVDEEGEYTYFESEPVVMITDDDRVQTGVWGNYGGSLNGVWTDATGTICKAKYWMPLCKTPTKVRL